MHGGSGSALSNGCSWLTHPDGRGYFCYGGNLRAGPVTFDSGDEVSAVVDSTHCGNDIGKVLEKAEPLPIEFTEETFFRSGLCL